MAEGNEEGKGKKEKQTVLSSFFAPRKAAAEKPPDEVEVVATDSGDRSGDAPNVPKLQTHTSDTTASRDKGSMPELKRHQTDAAGGQRAREEPREAYTMRVLKVKES